MPLKTSPAADRRIHKVYVTRNTEYHLRKDQCVAVRDRRSGEWLRAHLALKQRIHGGLKFSRQGGIHATVGLPTWASRCSSTPRAATS